MFVNFQFPQTLHAVARTKLVLPLSSYWSHCVLKKRHTKKAIILIEEIGQFEGCLIWTRVVQTLLSSCFSVASFDYFSSCNDNNNIPKMPTRLWLVRFFCFLFSQQIPPWQHQGYLVYNTRVLFFAHGRFGLIPDFLVHLKSRWACCPGNKCTSQTYSKADLCSGLVRATNIISKI